VGGKISASGPLIKEGGTTQKGEPRIGEREKKVASRSRRKTSSTAENSEIGRSPALRPAREERRWWRKEEENRHTLRPENSPEGKLIKFDVGQGEQIPSGQNETKGSEMGPGTDIGTHR